jgi:hypothetical protein
VQTDGSYALYPRLMASTVGKTLQLRWSVHQSYQAELREAKAALQVGDYRLALGSAHRAWEYFRESVLALLGKSKAEIDELAKKERTLGLHERGLRREYEGTTGDCLPAIPRGRSSSTASASAARQNIEASQRASKKRTTR